MRVLYVVHALPPDTYGGTELYTRHVAETLAPDHEVAVATPRGHEADVDGATVFALPDPVDWADPTGQDSGLASGVTHEAVDDRFAEVLDAFDPAVAHLQHFKYLSAALPATCRERDVVCVATLHDFWTVCHREHLYRPDGTLCAGPESVAKCADCYAQALQAGGRTRGRATETDGEPTDDAANVSSAAATDPGGASGRDGRREAVAKRAKRLDEALAAIDRLIAPSAFLREKFVEFGTPRERVVQRRNGIPVDRFPDTDFDGSGPLRVGYAGRVAPLKGVDLLVRAFDSVGDGELYVFGRFDPDGDPYHARLEAAANERVTFHGRYADSATPYESVDVLAVPSRWYENSPLVIQEAFASGVPVVTADVGGMAELVTDGRDGLTFAVGDADSLAARLERLAESPSLVARLRSGIEEPKRLSEHAADLVELYAAEVRGEDPRRDVERE